MNNKDYGSENDNSSVIYIEFDGYKFIFMGDAGVDVEKAVLKKYDLSDIVVLKEGTLLHGTYKNLEGLKYIATAGLISSDFIDSRKSKYPACVSVWKLKEDYKLKDYINLYSGATIKYSGLLIDDEYSQEIKTDIISYDDLSHVNQILRQNPCRIWNMEQTKEARFLPSLVQDKVQYYMEYLLTVLKEYWLDEHMRKMLKN